MSQLLSRGSLRTEHSCLKPPKRDGIIRLYIRRGRLRRGPCSSPWLSGGVAPRKKGAVRPPLSHTLLGGGARAVSQMGGSPGHFQGGFWPKGATGRVSHPGQEFFRGTPPMVSYGRDLVAQLTLLLKNRGPPSRKENSCLKPPKRDGIIRIYIRRGRLRRGPCISHYLLGGGRPSEKARRTASSLPYPAARGGLAVTQMGGSPGHFQGGFGGVPPPGRVSHPGQEFFRGTPPMVSGVAWAGQGLPSTRVQCWLCHAKKDPQ
jgi:hypothetical protein